MKAVNRYDERVLRGSDVGYDKYTLESNHLRKDTESQEMSKNLEPTVYALKEGTLGESTKSEKKEHNELVILAIVLHCDSAHSKVILSNIAINDH